MGSPRPANASHIKFQLSSVPSKGKADDASPRSRSRFDDINSVSSSTAAHENMIAEDALDEVPGTAEPSLHSLEENSWDRKVILSLDGGGVRGLTSLLLLQELMSQVAILEQEADRNALSSAYSPWVDSGTGDEKQQGYKPCHYFDYIGGTSTGGLIAIMLGRLRMDIDATIREYQIFCATVFERSSPRLIRLLGGSDNAAREEALRKIFDSPIPEQPSPGEVRREFRSDAIRCRTIVCSIKSSQNNDFKEPFLFRSYDHRRRSRSPFERNPGSASEFDILSVARATSRAPTYFDPIQVQKSHYYDGAMELNNPSWEVINEVNLLNQGTRNPIFLLLSIGGGNCKRNTSKDLFSDNSLQRGLNDISEHIDQKLRDESKRQNFHYYRLDVDKGLRYVRLDEWKPKKTGETTLKRIKSAVKNYIQSENIKSSIRECAQALVQTRTRRAGTMRWETFATGIRYHCPIEGCEYRTRRFETRNELLDHLQMHHGKPPPDVEHYAEIQRLLDRGRTNSS